MKRFEPLTDRLTLRKYVGSMKQLAGVKRYRLEDGFSRGVEAVDVRTGGGLEYTVLPGRGMDIAFLSYRGVPISYLSAAEIQSAEYYEPEGMNWLRGFYAGMLTTCGLSNVGGSCGEVHPVIGPRDFGLHGRLSYTPASEVCASARWEDGVYELKVSGKLTESIVHGEHFTLRRRVTSKFGSRQLAVRDVVENEGNQPQPMMLLYHMNVGYPLLNEDARLLLAASRTEGADETAQSEIHLCREFHAPIPKRPERCYFHAPIAGADGKTRVALVNDRLELGVRFTFAPEQLPCLTEWKMMSEGEYVVGIEPGNVHPIGRTAAAAKGALPILEPGEIRRFEFEIDILDGADEIAAAEGEIAALGGEEARA